MKTATRPPKLDDYWCTACRYGVSVLRPPLRCPMCGGRVWRPERPR